MTTRAPLLALTGGGTGGHIYPALAVAEEMKRRGWETVYFGTPAGLEARLAPAAGIPFRAITALPVKRRRLFANLTTLAALWRGFHEARAKLRRTRPAVLFATGGYASVPTSLAAASLGIPIVVHESNAVPGLATRLIARLARRSLTCWDDPARRAENVGLPFRSGIAPTAREEARKKLGLGERALLLIVFGGSRGARSLNAALATITASLSGMKIIWATGTEEFDKVRRRLGEAAPHVQLLPYIENMPELLPAADLALTRAGAMTLAELAAAGVPAILAPYPFATGDHQAANARRVAEAGAAVIVEDHLMINELLPAIRKLTGDAARRRAMAAKMRALARPEATARVAEILVEEAKKRGPEPVA